MIEILNVLGIIILTAAATIFGLRWSDRRCWDKIQKMNVKTPNADTNSAMKDLASGGNTHYKNSQEMYSDLGI